MKYLYDFVGFGITNEKNGKKACNPLNFKQIIMVERFWNDFCHIAKQKFIKMM